jgi:glyoxylase-like metal-dependent hydrolase (beta-lactamase superfamily II)
VDLDIQTLVVSPFQQNCRLVVDRASRDAVLFDPGDEADRILAAVEASGARVTHILNTHGHIDHAGAVAPVQEALDVPFGIHPADRHFIEALPERGAAWGMGPVAVPRMDLDLSETTTIPFGRGEIRVLATPGHTPGGVTFLIGEHGIFGDTLFKGSIGRTDLGGDAEVYARTLRDVVLALPDDVVVHAGHGPDSTIGEERRTNPFLTGQIPLAGGFV